MDVGAHRLQIVPAHRRHLGHIPVTDKFSVLVIVSRREGPRLVCQHGQVSRLAGKENVPGPAVAVVQGADADGVPGRQPGAGPAVIEDQGKFRVQQGEHLHAVFPPQGDQDLAVAAALEGPAPLLQGRLHGPEAVADQGAAVPLEGLHPRLAQSHDAQPVEEQRPAGGLDGPALIRPPALQAGEMPLQLGSADILPCVSHDRAHKNLAF